MGKVATPQVRLATAKDRDQILRFVEDQGFNPRDTRTWDALEMGAATAWRGSELIGAIPYEPRRYRGVNGAWAARHESVVAVHPDWRNQGIGSRMQTALTEAHGSPLSVFREQPESDAYRWYAKNEFSRQETIESWFLDPQPVDASPALVWRPEEARVPELELHELWTRCHERAHGFVERDDRPLFAWLTVHPYRDRYDFEVLTLGEGSNVRGYALLGVGVLHSDTTRIDILDFAFADEPVLVELIAAVEAHGAKRGYRPVRWPIAQGDTLCRHVAESRGYENRWSFDFLTHGVEEGAPTGPSRYFGLDYI